MSFSNYSEGQKAPSSKHRPTSCKKIHEIFSTLTEYQEIFLFIIQSFTVQPIARTLRCKRTSLNYLATFNQSTVGSNILLFNTKVTTVRPTREFTGATMVMVVSRSLTASVSGSPVLMMFPSSSTTLIVSVIVFVCFTS